MIDEDLLRGLGTPPGPTLIRPLPEIAARARVLRRHRRFTAAAATSLVVAGVTAATTVLPNPVHQDRTIAPAAKAASVAETLKNCYPGSSRSKPVSPAAISQVLFLPPASLAGPFRDEPRPAMHSQLTCQPAASVGTWADVSAGTVNATVQLEGPDRGDPTSRGLTFPMDGDRPRTVDVNGCEATLYYAKSKRLGTMFWTAADGSTWTARVSGLSLDESLTAVRNVALDGAKIRENASPGERFDSIEPFAGRPFSGGAWVSTGYGRAHSTWYLSTFEFSGQHLNIQAASRRVDVNGVAGWLTEDSDGLRLTWEVARGIRASISGDLSATRAIALARATVPVPPTDPRWK